MLEMWLQEIAGGLRFVGKEFWHTTRNKWGYQLHHHMERISASNESFEVNFSSLRYCVILNRKPVEPAFERINVFLTLSTW